MLLYERPVYNEKLQQDIDLEGKRGLNALWFKGCRWHQGFVQAKRCLPLFWCRYARGATPVFIWWRAEQAKWLHRQQAFTDGPRAAVSTSNHLMICVRTSRMARAFTRNQAELAPCIRHSCEVS